MSWTAVIIGAGTVIGGAVAGRGAGDAADAQSDASAAAIEEQRRQFDTLLNVTSNQRAIGNQALNALGSIYGYQPAAGFANDEFDITGGVSRLRATQPVIAGNAELPPGTTVQHAHDGYYNVFYNGQRIGYLRPGGPNGRFVNDTGTDTNELWRQWEEEQRVIAGNRTNDMASPPGGNTPAGPDYSAFYQSPDYQFRLNEGLNAVQNSAAARGGLYSGNAFRGINEFAQGSAANEFGNYVNRQLALAGMGQAATTQAGNAALTTGANIGNLLVNQGNARASGIVGQTNAITGGINDLASLYGLWRGGFFGGGNTSGLGP